LSADAEMNMIGEFRNKRVDLPPDGVFHSGEVPVTAQTPNKPVAGFIAYKGATGLVRVWGEVEPTPTGWHKWRAGVVSAIRQAAFARYNDTRERLRQRRAAILRELEAPDALTLRRMEREQVMRLVLEWLFPDFNKAAQAYKDSA